MFHIVIVFPSGTDRRTRHEQNHLDRDDLDQSRSDDEERHPLEYFRKLFRSEGVQNWTVMTEFERF